MVQCKCSQTNNAGSAKHLQVLLSFVCCVLCEEQEEVAIAYLHHRIEMFNEQSGTADNSSPLSQTGILQHVLSYVGPGHWWFVSTVCSLWRDLYRELRSVQVVGYDDGLSKISITCTPQMTLYSAVFASISRASLAEQESTHISGHRGETAAGKYADVNTLAAARELGIVPFTLATMHECALCNKLTVMQILRAEGCAWDRFVCTAAAGRGYFEMLRWAREHGCEWDHFHIHHIAASKGNIEMTAWVKQQLLMTAQAKIHQQPDIFTSDAIYFGDAFCAAAAHGHTAMCAYLHAEQTPWHPFTCCAAAEGAQLDTLIWLREHGCPCSRHVIYAAADGGSIEIMAYLQAEGFIESARDLQSMLQNAGAGINVSDQNGTFYTNPPPYNNSKLAAAQWLRQQGADWPDELSHALDGRPWADDMIAWARAEGCTSPADTEE
jgi:hypothetical protein